jgi:hypothetical protein
MYWEPGRAVSATHRSRRWPRRSRSGSTSTARGNERTLIAVPDGRRPLSEGLVVEASIVARLLRVRLLAVDASLIVVPAQVKGRPRAHAALAPVTPRAIGGGLATAERFLDEGAASLSASRAIAGRR